MWTDTLISEEWLRSAVGLLVRVVECGAALVIFAAAALAFVRLGRLVLGRAASSGAGTGLTPVRLSFARLLALGLEFQLAADLLRTAVAPTFPQIGQLAAVAAIRTALNYFLGRELRDEAAHEARAK